MEQIRSFIAVELPDELRVSLSQLQVRLKSGGQFSVKWSDPYSIHLTLKFLGNITPDKIGQLTKAIEEAAHGIPPLRLALTELGVFPNPRRVQVIWVGLEGDLNKLGQLQQRIETRVSPLGFPTETRKFTPHLTLGRVRERASPIERESLGRFITTSRFKIDSQFNVDSIHLMRSQLTSGGAIYSKISSVPLK